MKINTTKVKVSIPDILDRFKSGFDAVKKKLINRDEELEALKLCLLCKGHLMLDGPAGVAKSKLARLGFQVLGGEDIVRYNIQMMPNTQAEEIFGPMSITKLREKEIIHYNTKGNLPEAHVAYLDELYRGSDSILPTMMGILNERTFHNGQIVQKCPLITAIGTTNFITDRPELEAFHDRWLITCSVKPMDSAAARLRMLGLFLEDESDKVDIEEPLELHELSRLHDAVKAVEVPQIMLELYEELVEKYRVAVPNVYVSDRRYCQAVRLIQAAILLESDGQAVENPDASIVSVAKYAILRSQEKEHREAMDQALSAVVGNYERMNQEEPDISAIEQGAANLQKKYDPNISKDKKDRLYRQCVEGLEQIVGLAPDQQFTLPRNIERSKRVIDRLESLKNTLASDLGLTS
jgi:MoxR-like ATPase